jgi:toxin HigB-1
MITSFGSKETEKIWNGDRVKNLPQEIQQIERRKLRMLNNSQNLIDLKVPPSNSLRNFQAR